MDLSGSRPHFIPVIFWHDQHSCPPLTESQTAYKLAELFGAVAQLGARLNGIQKVRGSNPLSYTRKSPGSNRGHLYGDVAQLVRANDS